MEFLSPDGPPGESLSLGLATSYGSIQPAQLQQQFIEFSCKRFSSIISSSEGITKAPIRLQIYRLVCAYVVCMQQNQVFLPPGSFMLYAMGDKVFV